MPSADMIVPHQPMVVAKSVHFPGWCFMLYSAQKEKNPKSTVRRSSTVVACMRMPSSHRKIFERILAGSKVAKFDCKNITALLVPCIKRLSV